MSLFIRLLKIPLEGLRIAGLADSCAAGTLLERPVEFALDCFVTCAVLAAMDEFVCPVTLPMPLSSREAGSLVAFALTLLGGLAVGVLSVLGGDGVFLLKKLLSGEVLPVLIWLPEVGAGDVAATPTPVVVVF